MHIKIWLGYNLAVQIHRQVLDCYCLKKWDLRFKREWTTVTRMSDVVRLFVPHKRALTRERSCPLCSILNTENLILWTHQHLLYERQVKPPHDSLDIIHNHAVPVSVELCTHRPTVNCASLPLSALTIFIRLLVNEALFKVLLFPTVLAETTW